MFRKDHQKRRERELRKKEAKKVADELERKRTAGKREMSDILEQLDVLFQAETGRALRMAFEEKASPEEIASALDIPKEHVEYLFDVAGICRVVF